MQFKNGISVTHKRGCKDTKKLAEGSLQLIGGVEGIRTPDTLSAYTNFPDSPLQPLEHHS